MRQKFTQTDTTTAMKEESLSGSLNLSVGVPGKIILRFSLPIIAGMLFQQVYSIVDTAIVGHFLGLSALAGVGATTSLSYLVSGFSIGCCNGFGIPAASCYGAKDEKGIRTYFTGSIYLAAVMALLITLLTLSFTGTLLSLMNTPADVYRYSQTYIRIIFLGTPLVFAYNLVAAMMRSVGDSKTPLIALLLASGINLILDFWFIGGLELGIAGAALATIISQGLSALFCLIHIAKAMPWLFPRTADLHPETKQFRELLSMALPMGIQDSIMSIGLVILQSSVNSLGALVIAATTAGGKISYFFAIFFEGLGTALASYTSQNLGAGKPARLMEGARASFLIGIGYSLLSVLIMLIGGRTFVQLFLSSTDPELISMGFTYAMIAVAFCPAALALNVFRYMIQGMGRPAFSLLAGGVEVISRLFAAWVLIPASGFTGACMASPIAWSLAALVLLPVFIRLLKKQNDYREYDRT